ncbi:HlyD family efflux transporter periplasmic adaptor subunit [Novosphingobium sp. FSY-8]|uniref:HlyD family efflux transporter periplasmic adaptor subunit n=1 Tax=Novosphingobium ovatum TaxID=1908523 RepID=A0ABW9XDV9_9SPHN|nr:efflux RND transporter periplasmic adaptor subunit [Novosphingobium ovatum]NBC36733.1 HlyD family efflux transporter periplasmic adaptor subunit [Novosphingobium ovatum]
MNDHASHPDRERSTPLSDLDTAARSSARATRKKALLLLGGAVVLGLAAWGGHAWMTADTHEGTDDAYVTGNIVQVTAREGGTVIAVHAEGTQQVNAGAPLVDLDPALADAGVAAAEAELARAVRGVRQGFSRIDTADAEIAEAQSRLSAAQNDLSRRQPAVAAGAVSGEEAAHASDAVRAATAALALARSHRVEAESAVAGTGIAGNPQVMAAVAALRRAAILRARMHITAPVAGVVANRAVQMGQQVAPGTPLMAVVPLNKVWVEANFRETQLAHIRIGQAVTLHSDAYGDDVTFHGRVIGMNAGSGSAFALLPAQNASGNWIKIVQRVPVRIALDPAELNANPLRLGLSMTVDVDTRDHAGAPVMSKAAQIQPAQPLDTVSPEVEARINAIIAANSGGRVR